MKTATYKVLQTIINTESITKAPFMLDPVKKMGNFKNTENIFKVKRNLKQTKKFCQSL